jgi:hypothetical protein
VFRQSKPPGWKGSDYRRFCQGWQAAKDHDAPKLTEKEAVEAGAKAAYHAVVMDGNKWPRCDGGRIRPEEFRLAIKAALRAAAIKFKEEP